MIADETTLVGGKLEGDVDGDSVRDRVSVRIDQAGAGACAAFLLVETKLAVYSAPVELVGGEDVAALRELGLPAAHSLSQVDDEPGAEIVVRVHVGASTEFFAVFTLRDASLRRVQPATPNGLFGYGGSVTHLEAVDCSRPGTIVVASATSRGEGYLYTRALFALRGPSIDKLSVAKRFVPADEIGSIAVLQAPPFGSCPSAA